MSLFGGLFGHNKESAQASGATPDAAMSPAPSPYLPQYPAASMPALPSLPSQPALPAAPPPTRQGRAGAFDDDHYRQTMLGLAAGFFGSRNLGDGLANAAQTIAAGNEDARRQRQFQYGGPDNAFEYTTDPRTGERSYRLLPEVESYLHDKKGMITPDKALDFNGRYALALQGLPEDQRPGAAQYMAAHPDLYPGFSPALVGAGGLIGLSASTGQTVTQSGAAVRAATAENHRQEARVAQHDLGERRLAVAQGRAAVAASQGQQRIAISRDNNALAHQRYASTHPVQVTNEAQWRALAPGTPYIAPDGSHRTKK